MKNYRARFFYAGTIGILGLALFLSAAAAPLGVQTVGTPASEMVLAVDPEHSKVHWTVDSTLHAVHGTFNLKSGTVHIDPETGKAAGEIVVAATSGESGNTSRDARMHKEILETVKFPDAVFHPTQMEGKVSAAGSSDVKLRGVLSLHGGDHEVTAQVHADLSGDHWKGTAGFDVPYVSWGIKDPSNFLLKVKHSVHVELEISGDVQQPQAAQ